MAGPPSQLIRINGVLLYKCLKGICCLCIGSWRWRQRLVPDGGNCFQDYTVSHSERRRRENVSRCSPAARHGHCSRCTVRCRCIRRRSALHSRWKSWPSVRPNWIPAHFAVNGVYIWLTTSHASWTMTYNHFQTWVNPFKYEGWNFNSGNYLFTAYTKWIHVSKFYCPSM